MDKKVNAQRIEFTINNEDYRMDRYKSNVVLMFKKIDGVYDFVSAKSVLRMKLNEIDGKKFNLEITKKYNTHYLGSKLCSLLKQKC